MSRYLLDTDTAIELLRGRNHSVVERLAVYRRENVALCVITAAELLFGAYLSRQPIQNVELCRKFCESFPVLPLTYACAELSASVRADLETRGQRIGPYDVLIAGIALAEDRVLVTHNTREFGRVPRLRIEDWVSS